MGNKSIDLIAEHLRARRSSLLEEVANTEDDLQEIKALRESEIEEQAQEEITAKFLSRMSERKLQTVQEIDSTLARMAGGDYGSCEDCGEPIPLERLQVVPTTRFCVDCLSDRERRGRQIVQWEENIGSIPPDFSTLTAEK